MKVVFISNFISHHQLPLSHAIKNHPDCSEYTFIATTPTDQERIELGYEDGNKKYDFVCCTYESNEKQVQAESLLWNADIVIWGSAPYEMLQKRLDAGKLTYRYSERIFRQGIYPLLKKRNREWFETVFGQYRSSNFYLLSTGAFSAADYKVIRAFPQKMLKWGYFPPFEEKSLAVKKSDRVEIIWCARLIQLKHPESMIYLAKYLKKQELNFHITMVGNGELLEEVQACVVKNHLDDCIALTGGVSAEKVRPYMNNADILVFTSDKREGWGAVLNEGMNSYCVPVVSHEIGAAPYLVHTGENGLLFESKNWKHMSEQVAFLIKNPEKRKEMAQKAYHTIAGEWNAEKAAANLLEFSKSVLAGHPQMMHTGPCSEAPILRISDVKKTLK